MTVNHPLERILSLLKNPRKTANGYSSLCPAHDDKERSLSISTGDDDCVLLKCFAGCPAEEIVKALGLNMADLFVKVGGRGGVFPGKKAAHLHKDGKPDDIKEERLCNAPCTPLAHPNTGCTLKEYSDAKRLPVDFLRALGLSDITYQDRPAIRIPYYDEIGNEIAVQFRTGLFKGDGNDDRFRWKKGSKPCLYGLQRKPVEKYRIICEGASDCQTLWLHGIPAIGIPGADLWKEDRDAIYFEGIDPIYVVVEPDTGGDAVKKWLSESRIRVRAKLISLGECKDPSGLYLKDSDHFRERFQEAMNQAVSWRAMDATEREKVKRESWAQCKALAESGAIIERYIADLCRIGVVGEERIAKILYLSMVSRFLSRPVSNVLKGPSAGGKSFLVDCVLRFFPQCAFYALTSMSEHALAYSNEPLKNRFIIFYEAAGLNSDLASYMLRSLLSEGRVRYETVEKTKDGLEPRLIEREGPTGAIITTTAIRLHPENETRLLSMTVTDTKEQTQKIMLALAEESPDSEIDFNPWHSLQMWLEHSEHRVIIPYATSLAKQVPPIAVRLRRDFTQVLNLIRAHAILNQAQRAKDKDGAIIATVEDYATVRDLVLDFISEGIGAAVPESIRETVEAVRGVIEGGSAHATVAQVAQALDLDRSAISRRISAAIEKGYLVNLENKKGKSKKIIIGDSLPEEVEVLPPTEKLGVCSCARVQEGVDTPLPPPEFKDLREVRI